MNKKTNAIENDVMDEKKELSIWEIKMTEAERIRLFDKFFLEYTPKWFAFVGWLLVVGGLEFVRQNTEQFIVDVLYAVSYLLIFFYLHTLINTFPFHRVVPSKFIKTDRHALVFSIVLSLIPLILMNLYLDDVVSSLASNLSI
jgi:hypothetical protein